MKRLIKQFLDDGLSRRQLMTGLSALGLSGVAANSMAQSLAPFGQGATAPPVSAVREMRGTGGALFVQQLKAAGVEYIFFNPSTGDYPIFDALVDEPGIQLIKGIHEGAVIAMADGYARASGKTGVVIVANIGLPNAMTQMINSWKDQIPLLVAVAAVEQDNMGGDQFQDTISGLPFASKFMLLPAGIVILGRVVTVGNGLTFTAIFAVSAKQLYRSVPMTV